jgi:hypothetical protein
MKGKKSDGPGPEPKIAHIGWSHGTKKGKHKHGGVLTIAFREAVLGMILLGFSFCSPSDQFSRVQGKKDALQRMRTLSLAFKYLDDWQGMIREVLKCLCNHEFDKLERFCGHSLKDVLWHKKPTKPKMLVETCCIVPGWSKAWYGRQGMSSPLSRVSIRDLADAGIKVHVKKEKQQFKDLMGLDSVLAKLRSIKPRIMMFDEAEGLKEIHQLPPELRALIGNALAKHA